MYNGEREQGVSMATLEGLMKRTRLELADLKLPLYERFTTSGEGTRYNLRSENLEHAVIYPLGDAENPLTEGTDYFLDHRGGVVVFPQTQNAGDIFVVEGERAAHFTDEEIQTFVESAFAMHTRNRRPAENYSSLPSSEDYLVALLAKIEALWVLKTSAAFDINIHAPEGMFIPRAQRYQQISDLLRETEMRYKEMGNAMGVGLYALEMFTLRRVSRLTGRYVPVYLDREVDDTRPAQRVFPTIGSQGAPVAKNTVTSYDLHIFQGRPFSETFTLTDDSGDPLDIETFSDFDVSIWRTPYSVHGHRHVVPQPNLELDPSTGSVIVSMSAEDTRKLESTGAYVWSFVWSTEGNPITLMHGNVLVETSYPYKNVNVTVVG
jgi:hypothetical protein